MKFSLLVRAAIRNDNKKKSLKYFQNQKNQIKDEKARLCRKRSVALEVAETADGSKINSEDALKWLDEEEKRINKTTSQMDKDIKEMIKIETDESKKAIDASGLS
mgnify:CR=1 FL=1